MKKFGVGIVLHLWFCSALSALNHRDTLGHIVGTKFTAISDKKKELSEPGDKMTVLGTLSAMECSLQCLEKDICMSFNVCQETFQGRPVRCELFKRRAVHENLHPSPCSYYERVRESFMVLSQTKSYARILSSLLKCTITNMA